MNCKICFENFNHKERIPITLMLCGHSVCLDCLAELKQQIYQCPLCRAEIISEKPNYAFLEFLETTQFVYYSILI
jgi:hypothetical protein